MMQLSDVFLGLGEENFGELLRTVSIGKLRTYHLYERFKVRAHFSKLNSETLRRAAPKLFERLKQYDEEYSTDVAQIVLVSHLGMIGAVLDFLGVPHEDGFFAKDTDVKQYLTDGWQQSVYDKFAGVYPKPALVFYLNHLAWEIAKSAELFRPAA